MPMHLLLVHLLHTVIGLYSTGQKKLLEEIGERLRIGFGSSCTSVE